MILYRNSPHLSIPIFNFFQKKSKVSTIPSIFALHQTPAQLSSPHKFTPNHPPDESRLLSIRPPNPTCSRRSASWRIQTLYPRPHRQTSRGFVPAVQRARKRGRNLWRGRGPEKWESTQFVRKPDGFPTQCVLTSGVVHQRSSHFSGPLLRSQFLPSFSRPLHRRYEAARGRPYSPLRLQNRAQHILII